MKRKSIFLLGTILAGVALVGGTFAAWAVTDNANKIDVTITPGTISTGDNTAVTLEYGTKELINIENLGIGQTVGPYKLGLKATTGDGAAFTKGVLDLELKGAENEDLINYVTVVVKTVDNNVETVWKTLNAANPTVKDKSPYASMTSGSEKEVRFYVTLAESVRTVYETVKDQSITLSVDWNLESHEEVTSSTTIYYENYYEWDTVAAYAFNDSGEMLPWPGRQMTNVKGDIWAVNIDNGFTKIIFNNGNSGEGNQTGNIPLESGKPYYHYNTTSTAWEWTTAPDISAETDYYITGVNGVWQLDANYKLVPTAGTVAVPTALQQSVGTATYSYTHKLENFQVSQGFEVKVANNYNEWYGEKSSESSAPNVSLGAGVYNVYFNPEKSGNCYIYFEYLEITAKIGDNPVVLTNQKTDENVGNIGIYDIAVAANDVLSFKFGGVDLHFYTYDSVNEKDVKGGTTFTAESAGTVKVYLNTKLELWATLTPAS